MGKYVERVWTSRFASGGMSRAFDETSGSVYRAYVPDPIAYADVPLDHRAAADVVDAERAITRLEAGARGLRNTEALARILLRAEAVASSYIEGLEVSPQRLLRADVARREADETHDDTALEVLANVDAMAYAVEQSAGPVTRHRLLMTHRRLLEGTALARHAGELRTEQNWIGGGGIAPFRASFVPPPPEEVPRLLDDLCAFCQRTDLPAVAQAAIAHAQFETIHPFVDGNGRTGRALVHMIFRYRELTAATLPPVSLALATRAADYVEALGRTRYDGSPTDPAAIAGVNAWIGLFAASCTRAVADAEDFERTAARIHADWRGRLASIRSDAAALRMLDRLIATPIVTVATVQRDLDVSYTAANAAIDRLVGAAILQPTKAGRRNRAFEAREVVDAFTLLERQLASPARDTSVERPARPVPSRPIRSR